MLLGGVCDFKVRKFVSNDIAEILLELALSTNQAIKVRRKSICRDGYRVDYSYQATNTYASSPWYLAPAIESSTTVVEKEEKEIIDFKLIVQQDNSIRIVLCHVKTTKQFAKKRLKITKRHSWSSRKSNKDRQSNGQKKKATQ